jgi:hypothetical protein
VLERRYYNRESEAGRTPAIPSLDLAFYRLGYHLRLAQFATPDAATTGRSCLLHSDCGIGVARPAPIEKPDLPARLVDDSRSRDRVCDPRCPAIVQEINGC